MEKVDKHIDQLITRFLTGEASDSEKSSLEQWLAQSAANKKYFDGIKFIYDKASTIHTNVDFDVDKAWSSVKGQMKFTPKVELKPQKAQWGWIKIAASILAIISVSTIIYLTLRQETTLTITNVVAIASKDSVITKKLPDSTQIFLNKRTKLSYNPDYGKKNREVVLEGEAYFNATHSDDKPLTIKAENTFIKDIGTAFNIKAYPEEDIIEVYVETGKVIFYTKDDSGLTLIKGEVGVYNKKSNTFYRKQTVEANVLSYKTKSFTFINAKLSDVIRQVNSVYTQQISLKNSELSNCLITVTFEDETIDTIVSIITETLNLKSIKTNEGFAIDGEKCDNP